MTERDILCLIEQDSWMMGILKLVRDLNLPDWWIGAGFVRSKVWDTLHNYAKQTPLPDIDVIYFDKKDISEKTEKEYEKFLSKKDSSIKWSIKNQARMHILHKDKPYKDASEGLAQWVETATCIGVRLNRKNGLELTAPRGIEDLVNLILRPTHNTPQGKKLFLERIKKKHWLTKWPKLRIKY